MATPSLKIGDVTLEGGRFGGKEWPQTLGLEAPRVTWYLPVEEASKVLAGPRETSITYTSSDGKTKKIERVYVVGEADSPDALVRGVILTDVRFFLPFAQVRASYNVTVQSGTGRQTTADGIPTTTLPIVANFLYVPTSLRGSDDGPLGTPWNATQIALDVLKKACEGHDFPKITFRDLSRPRSSFIPNDVFVDVDGQTAIGQTLGALGGLDIRVADDGAIELVDAYLGAEKRTVEEAVTKTLGSSPLASLEGKGKLRFISMSNVCPRAGKIQFTRRCEVRADSFEDTPANRYTTMNDNTIWGQTNDPVMVNVAKVTDLSLPVPASVPSGIGGGKTAVMGTLLPMDALIDGIAAKADQPSGAPALSRSLLLQGGGGLVSSSLILSGRAALLYIVQDRSYLAGAGPSVIWSSRLGEIINSHRSLYQLNPVFARACRKGSIKAERAALLDAVSQKRQPATLYMDYVERPKQPGMAKNDAWGFLQNSIPPNNPNTQEFVTGVKTYADPGTFNTNPFRIAGVTSTAPYGALPAPFNVQCRDASLGIFEWEPARQDTSRLSRAAETTPGLVWVAPVIGSLKLSSRTLAIAFWDQAKQLLTHRVAMIFSAVPAGQDNRKALHAYDVTIEQALSRLGAPSDSVVARAPTRELRVREGVTEARIPWDDDFRNDILGCFFETGTGDPTKLIPVNDAQLRDFAISVFANYVQATLDHYEGGMLLPFTTDVKPIGSLRNVTTRIDADGKMYTSLRCVGAAPVTPPENLMLQSSRNILFGGLG